MNSVVLFVVEVIVDDSCVELVTVVVAIVVM